MANENYVATTDILLAEQIMFADGSREILKGATIRTSRGSITGLLGRNGSGKSTLLQCVFGTRAAAQCDVFVNGIRMNNAYSSHRLINYLPQRSFMPAGMRVRKVLQQYGIPQDVVLYYFPELQAYLDAVTHELSGGHERLLSVLLILLADTRFTLLDEPFTHLMPMHTDALIGLLQQQKHRKGIILTDHQHPPLLQVSDILYMLHDGQSIFVKDKEDLKLHGFVRE